MIVGGQDCLIRVRYIKAGIIPGLIGAKRYFYSLVQEPEGKINEITLP